MKRDVIKVYNVPQSIKKLDNGLLMNYNYNFSVVYETIQTFEKVNEKKLIEYLYKAYEDTDVFRIYLLSKEEFTRFLHTMLPKYV